MDDLFEASDVDQFDRRVLLDRRTVVVEVYPPVTADDVDRRSVLCVGRQQVAYQTSSICEGGKQVNITNAATLTVEKCRQN